MAVEVAALLMMPESLVKVGDHLRVLDLHDRGVRAQVAEFDGAQASSLYEGLLARDYR